MATIINQNDETALQSYVSAKFRSGIDVLRQELHATGFMSHAVTDESCQFYSRVDEASGLGRGIWVFDRWIGIDICADKVVVQIAYKGL